jgi:hypothetical protein
MPNHPNAMGRGLVLVLILALPVAGCRTARTAADEVVNAAEEAGQAIASIAPPIRALSLWCRVPSPMWTAARAPF